VSANDERNEEICEELEQAYAAERTLLRERCAGAGGLPAMLVLELAAEAVALRARVVVYEARADACVYRAQGCACGPAGDGPRAQCEVERQLWVQMRAAGIAALAAIEDVLGVKRTTPSRTARRRQRHA
jgi:hypothetical protein